MMNLLSLEVLPPPQKKKMVFRIVLSEKIISNQGISLEFLGQKKKLRMELTLWCVKYASSVGSFQAGRW